MPHSSSSINNRSVATAHRDLWLDVLRGVAVLGVIGTHAKLPPAMTEGWLSIPVGLWQKGGWVGVDLFFVLSGFLVSGLLFKELLLFQKVSIAHFLLRRSFKIYPPFWIVLTGIITARLILHSPLPVQNIIGEIFFLQNYVGKISGPHWTLAIEEHFYLLLAGWFWLQTRGQSLSIEQIQRRFSLFPWLFLIIAVICLSFRFNASGTVKYSHEIFKTHLRVDALMFGAVISWAWHFRGLCFIHINTVNRCILMVSGTILLLPPFIVDAENRGRLFQTLCFNSFYLGSGFLVIAGQGVAFKNSLIRLLATIGTCSYGVYLCHEPLQRYFILWLVKPEQSLGTWTLYAVLYIGGSIACGMLLTRYIEKPCLRIRDNLFPSRSVKKLAS